MPPSVQVLYNLNSNTLYVLGLYDSSKTGSAKWINDATVAVTLLDERGTEIAGTTWPAALGYILSSDGDYKVTLGSGLTLRVGQKVRARVTASAGGAAAVFNAPLEVRERGAE